MNNRVISTFLLVIFFSSLVGCKATAVRNVEDTQFVAPSYASMNDIKQAIIRGGYKAGWKTRALSPGVLMASYSYKRNKFGAVVKILYDHDSYRINYHSSHNLKYKEPELTQASSSGFFQESSDFFQHNNPFSKKDDLPLASEKPATIHKIYNKWVTELDTRINLELAALGTKKQSVKVNRARADSRQYRKTVVRCDDTPQQTVSGQATISRASVNVRKGAGTHCSKVTAVRQQETFTLLGQKNNWYLIALANGSQGWIYAPLVRRLTGGKPVVSAKSVASTPPPPVPTPPPAAPTKNISIAVIRFKTLNKEAQDISLGELVSETFTSALVNSRNFKIIEREQLDKLVKEMEMGQTGFIETTDAVEIGKMLQADAIITGSVALLGGQIQLNARIIEIESAYVISADTKTTTYTLKNINRIAQEIVAKLARKLAN